MIIFTAFSDRDPSGHGSTPLGIKQLEILKETYPDG
ncbi:hypothetical protein [Parasphingorhabdus sp.]